MTSDVLIRPATSPSDMEAVRELCWEYRQYLLDYSEELRFSVSFAYPEPEYAALLASLEQKHARPRGLILLAELDGAPVGCAMYHALNDADIEIKRVFIRDAARGTGTGLKISQALLDQARKDGFRRALLDTSRQFNPAQQLYEKIGFTARGPYAELPPEFVELLVFYELNL